MSEEEKTTQLELPSDDITERLRPEMLQIGESREVIVDPRVFICSFPKSGTHFVEQIVQTICQPMPTERPWAGTFQGHSWTTEWIHIRKTLRRIGFIRDGTYAKGHVGYQKETANFLWGNGAAVLFVYRDPRDVAVSQTHHILNGKTHGHNEIYQDIGFDAALLAVIKGLDVYAGVMERWEHYAGWLEEDWVLSVKYEDLLNNKREVLSDIVRYIVGHSANVRGYQATIEEDILESVIDAMDRNSSRTDLSPTYREGKSGGWKTAFKKAHSLAFKQSDVNDWLIKLGYETDKDWKSDTEAARELEVAELKEKERVEAIEA
ncbi:MAG: hypothetical protein GWN61_00725, partial [candidate division Zixibacteria bacterium]|nr:sulfotransferase domain-containing protein [candidate division Zixibacteria bacterium]NIT70445.1 sulfotransferase domain-containing protein [candidate division KSB1 bacterium]NIW97403.1 hypothetical protein [Phycisphaerae bacterium]NIU12623.1 sulfotransferase domain-containing protein [candidate division Zixibacteria bacterium]NIV04752.1 hypothetical protein [candidate division Zixibacteria bacterium]